MEYHQHDLLAGNHQVVDVWEGIPISVQLCKEIGMDDDLSARLAKRTDDLCQRIRKTKLVQIIDQAIESSAVCKGTNTDNRVFQGISNRCQLTQYILGK